MALVIAMSCVILMALGCIGCASVRPSAANADASKTNSTIHAIAIGNLQIDAQTLEDGCKVLKNAATGVAVVAIEKDPANEQYVRLAVAALDTFATSGSYSPGELSKALSPVLKEANDPTISLGINSIADLYQMFFSRYATSAEDPDLVLFINALRDGGAAALPVVSYVPPTHPE